MRTQRNIDRKLVNNTPTALHKYANKPKTPIRAGAKSPGAKSRNLSLPKKGATNVSVNTSSAAKLLTNSTVNFNNTVSMPYADAYASSKEKLLISKIITLKKEKNEISLEYQKKEETLMKQLEKIKNENNSLSSVLKQIIPIIKNNLDPEIKKQIQNMLESAENHPKTIDSETQCNLMFSESESRKSNKISTGPQSLNPDEELISKSNRDAEEVKIIENDDMNDMKTYMRFILMKQKTTRETHNSKIHDSDSNKEKQDKNNDVVHNVIPSFMKSLLYSSQQQ